MVSGAYMALTTIIVCRHYVMHPLRLLGNSGKLRFLGNLFQQDSLGAVIKKPPAIQETTGDAGSIPGSGRSPGGRNGDPLQYSGLGSPMDRGAWQAKVHRFTESQTPMSTHRLSFHFLQEDQSPRAALTTS